MCGVGPPNATCAGTDALVACVPAPFPGHIPPAGGNCCHGVNNICGYCGGYARVGGAYVFGAAGITDGMVLFDPLVIVPGGTLDVGLGVNLAGEAPSVITTRGLLVLMRSVASRGDVYPAILPPILFPAVALR